MFHVFVAELVVLGAVHLSLAEIVAAVAAAAVDAIVAAVAAAAAVVVDPFAFAAPAEL